jgi:hypothetical protein
MAKRGYLLALPGRPQSLIVSCDLIGITCGFDGVNRLAP